MKRIEIPLERWRYFFVFSGSNIVSFCEFHEKLFHTYMRLEAYHCPVVKKPANIGGYIWMPKKNGF